MKNLICVIALALITAFAAAQTAPSAIFYSDITSGPNTGGQSNAGAFVTIHGKGFGSSQGTSYVTVGGGNVASYQSWSDSAITFQLGSAAKTGNIVVNVAGVSSNSVPFTVRAGNIYFVSPSGNDKKSGSYSWPWKTVNHAAAVMQAGDIVYLENGYSRTNSQSNSTALILNRAGSSSAPMAIVAYPNSTATIGSSSSVTTGVSVTASNWVLAGLSLSGSQTALSTSNVIGVRVAGSNISCPNGYGTGACLSTTGGSSIALLGNQVHDSGSTSSTDLENYQSVQLLGTNTVEVGWNQMLNTRGCNAISVQPNGSAQHALTIHDNFIQNTRCEAISLGNVDPAQGAVNVYNNIIAASGTGPQPGGTASDYGYAAIRVGGSSSTPVQIFNNTISDAGSFGGGSAGALRAQAPVKLTNNILYIASGEWYVSIDSTLSAVGGSNNLFYGNGMAPDMFSNSLSVDPLFVSASNGNFHLQSGSPAIDAGTTVQLASDFDGVLRPQGTAYDLGAYESISNGSASTAAGTMSASPASLSFGTVTTGQSATTSTVLTNTGAANVTLSGVNSTSSAFQASGISFPLTLAAGQSTTLTVTFAPTASGSQTGTIAVASNATNSPTNISVSGTGQTATPVVSLSPTSLTFASQTVATTSAAQNVTVSNTGTAPLSFSSIALTGSDFAMTNGCGASLAAGASCSIAVKFTPTAAGTRTGTITLTDNASGGTQQIALTGTGATATVAHQVTVAWSEAASVTGFNVYRSSTSGSSYTKINTSLISTTSYVDTAVSAGATYYYVVTAVDSNGVESAYSTQASATVPTP
ncbi:MAG TPA: choice-of-anchor D domain-containing protein [Terriglobales bacterium]